MMTYAERKRRAEAKKKQRLEDLRLVERDPHTGPTVKALLSLSAFSRDLTRKAAEIRDRLSREQSEKEKA